MEEDSKFTDDLIRNIKLSAFILLDDDFEEASSLISSIDSCLFNTLNKNKPSRDRFEPNA